MSYDSSHDIGSRLAKELSIGFNKNSQNLLEILKDLLRLCEGETLESKSILNSVVQLTQVKDVRVKKLVYLYLSFVNEKDSEIWLHIMNSVSNDLMDPNPFVRKAAILILTDSHSLSSSLNDMRIKSITNCLKDNNPYVRRYTVAGIGKLCGLLAIENVEFDSARLFDKLAQMIYQDEDPSVIVECIRCLQSRKKHEVKTELLISLLERMDMVEDWTKMEIVDLFTQCSNPDKMTHEEIFQVLNILDPYLNIKFEVLFTLLCATAMLRTAKRFSKIHLDVKARIIDFLFSQIPLLTQPSQSLHFSMLDSLLDESSRPKLFPYWKDFLLLSTDDAFLKMQKIKILSKAMAKENAVIIFRHICNTIMTSNESELTSLAVNSLFDLYILLPLKCENFVRSLLKIDNNSIVNASIRLLWKIIVHTKNQLSTDVNTLLNETASVYTKLTWYTAKIDFFLLVCAFSNSHITKTMLAILKQEILTWSDITDNSFKLVLLQAAFIFYFKSPGPFQKVLGKLIHLFLLEENLSLNRHAIMYYNLLKHDIEAAKKFASDLSEQFQNQSFIQQSSPRRFHHLHTLKFLES